MESKTKQLIVFVLIPLILIFLVVSFGNFRIERQHNLKVNFYNIGQGDATFIQTYAGNQILIDGGPSSSIINELGHDMPFWDRKIEMLIVSHPHEDHVAGLVEVLKRYKVDKVLLPDVEFDSSTFKEFLNLVEQKGIEKIYAAEGKRVYLDNATVFDIYYPPPGHFIANNDYEGFKDNKRNPNDVSVVGKLSFGQTQVLFTGDAGEDIEKLILPKYNLDSDILKVGHQGSKYSSSEDFLKEITPEFSVIMVGKNSYGHPAPETLQRIQASGSKIFRTDQDHTIKFVSDGKNITRK